MLKKDLYNEFEELFPSSPELLHYMFDFFDAHHLEGLLENIKDETK